MIYKNVLFIDHVVVVHAQSCPTLFDPVDCKPTWLLSPCDYLGKNTGVDCHFLFQGIFPTQGLKLHLCVSEVAGKIFTTSATWEALIDDRKRLKMVTFPFFQ